MRIPMYRAKPRMDRGFLEGYLSYDLSTNKAKLQTVETQGFIPVLSETVCEYTGRLDINGRRIYEKDIVRYGTGLWVVEYNAGKMGFVFRNIRSNGIVPGYAVTSVAEVVGNTIEDQDILRRKRCSR